MRTSFYIPIYFLLVSSLFGQAISIEVIDAITALPVEGAEVTVIYDNPTSPKRYDEQIKRTNEDGKSKFIGTGELGASLRVTNDGYYGFGVTNTEPFRCSGKELKGGVEKTIFLRAINEPIALYAKQTESKEYTSGQVPIPVVADWCGFDLLIGDWVTPYGRGENADFLLRFEREFVGFDKRYRQKSVEDERAFSKKAFAARREEWTEEKFRFRAGDWDMRLEIGFPSEKEGLVRVIDEFDPHSILRMPHKAPEDGYATDHTYSVKTYGESAWDQRDDVGFFLRTRVVLDEDGEIESANYAKIHGDFKVEQDGDLSFSYYFNPEVNDRNLEFDPRKNLFPKDTLGAFNFNLP